jgi:hypothetical protein
VGIIIDSTTQAYSKFLRPKIDFSGADWYGWDGRGLFVILTAVKRNALVQVVPHRRRPNFN